MNETKEQLVKSIKLAKHRLKQFSEEKLTSEAANIVFNRLLIEKAVMVKKLEDANESKFKNFVKKLVRKTKGTTLICDRF